jgi:hypothetical protein
MMFLQTELTLLVVNEHIIVSMKGNWKCIVWQLIKTMKGVLLCIA